MIETKFLLAGVCKNMLRTLPDEEEWAYHRARATEALEYLDATGAHDGTGLLDWLWDRFDEQDPDEQASDTAYWGEDEDEQAVDEDAYAQASVEKEEAG